jgi:hypothetical protein
MQYKRDVTPISCGLCITCKKLTHNETSVFVCHLKKRFFDGMMKVGIGLTVKGIQLEPG